MNTPLKSKKPASVQSRTPKNSAKQALCAKVKEAKSAVQSSAKRQPPQKEKELDLEISQKLLQSQKTDGYQALKKKLAAFKENLAVIRQKSSETDRKVSKLTSHAFE